MNVRLHNNLDITKWLFMPPIHANAADSSQIFRNPFCLGLPTSDLAELRILGLHRGLRQPSLLLALTEVVPDNSLGSDAQRAAASALVAFCDVS